MHDSSPALPTGLRNAHVSPGLKVRVGISEPSGKLVAHAYNEGFKTMVSAHRFWNSRTGAFRIPNASDLFETDFSLDSAGYTAMLLWKQKGAQAGMAGVYPWSYSQYLELAALLRPAWYAAPDLCTEPELAGTPEQVDYRIDATATLLEGCLRVLYDWANELAKTTTEEVVRDMIVPPVPVIQGWTTSQYQRSLDLTLEVWERWRPWLDAPALIGVGSVCRRDLHHPTHGLYAVLDGIEAHLPQNVKLHLFGVKGAALGKLKMHEHIESTDSMAFDFSARVKAHQSGRSNTISNRISEMSRWMSQAITQAAPAAGDQLLLC